MPVGIAIRDDVGITHWAPYSEKNAGSVDAGRRIVRELQRAGRPRLALACQGWNHPAPNVNQVRRVSTLVSSVTCMACILRM
jgi:hypothetical protein